VLTRLEALDVALQARPPHPLVGTGSLHASIVAGGRELSSYPDRATLQMERRILPDEAESVAIDEVRAILDALSREDASFRGTAAAIFSRPAYELGAVRKRAGTRGMSVRELIGAVRKHARERRGSEVAD